jgi:hypothetical protein
MAEESTTKGKEKRPAPIRPMIAPEAIQPIVRHNVAALFARSAATIETPCIFCSNDGVIRIMTTIVAERNQVSNIETMTAPA